MKVLYDKEVPRLAFLVWFDDGTCREVKSTGAQRKELFRLISRMNPGGLLASAPIDIKWGERTEDEAEQKAGPGSGGPGTEAGDHAAGELPGGV